LCRFDLRRMRGMILKEQGHHSEWSRTPRITKTSKAW
jgi:hypothetical protein